MPKKGVMNIVNRDLETGEIFFTKEVDGKIVPPELEEELKDEKN